jgi:hypothetical protein
MFVSIFNLPKCELLIFLMQMCYAIVEFIRGIVCEVLSSEIMRDVTLFWHTRNESNRRKRNIKFSMQDKLSK